jgi:hypothetical protein
VGGPGWTKCDMGFWRVRRVFVVVEVMVVVVVDSATSDTFVSCLSGDDADASDAFGLLGWWWLACISGPFVCTPGLLLHYLSSIRLSAVEFTPARLSFSLVKRKKT